MPRLRTTKARRFHMAAIRIGFLSGFALGCLAILIWSRTQPIHRDIVAEVAAPSPNAASEP
jgi:hypothetical protein